MLYRLRDLDAHEPSYAEQGCLVLRNIEKTVLVSGSEVELSTGVEVCVLGQSIAVIFLDQKLIELGLTCTPIVKSGIFLVQFSVINDTFSNICIKEGTPVCTVRAYAPSQVNPEETRRFPEVHGLADVLVSAFGKVLGDQ
jgi:hypothetical protein